MNKPVVDDVTKFKLISYLKDLSTDNMTTYDIHRALVNKFNVDPSMATVRRWCAKFDIPYKQAPGGRASVKQLKIRVTMLEAHIKTLSQLLKEVLKDNDVPLSSNFKEQLDHYGLIGDGQEGITL